MAYQSILNPHPVTGPLTDAQLRATAVPVSGAITANLGTVSGLALDATLIGGTQQSKITDGTNVVAVAASTAAASETAVDRLKVNAALRLLDTSQGAGSQLVAAKGDQASGLWVNVKAAPANQSVNVAQLVGTAADVNSGNKSAGTLRVVLATDQPALTNKLLVTPDSVALPANQSVNQAQVGGTATATNSGVVGAGVQRVVLATDVALPTGSNIIGALTANQSVNVAQANGVAMLMGNGVTGTGSIRVTIASDNTAFNVNATPPTLTKGTQGATGYSVQELKDAGRSCLAMTAQFTFAQTAETLLTMTLSVDGAATSTFSSRVITNGKRFRIQSITIEVETLGSGTAPQRAYLRLRRNTAGATTASSALQAVWCCVNNTAIVKSAAFMDYEVPDGLEMVGDGTGTFGFTLETPDWVTSTATGAAKITVIGYEY
jgi:hypothetical protein